MTDLSVNVLIEGYDFIRSDGERFFLVGKGDGHALLFSARRNEPLSGIVGLDTSR